MAKSVTIEVSFHELDLGLEEVQNTIRKLSSMKGLSVGIHPKKGGKPHPRGEGKSILEVAADNEFGLTATTPARSWLGQWVDENAKKHVGVLVREIENSINSKVPVEVGLEKAGEELAGSIRDRIASGKIPPPNAPRTIAEKGHDRTLVHTESMMNAVDHEVRL